MSNTLGNISSTEKFDIDRNRISMVMLFLMNIFLQFVEIFYENHVHVQLVNIYFVEKCIRTSIENPASGKRCSECDKLILVTKFTEHQQTPGLCIPCPIKCTICQNYIEKVNFREHFYRCCQQKITVNNDQAIPANTGLAYLQSMIHTAQLSEQQNQLSQLPTSLKGFDAVRRAREQNRSHLYYILIMTDLINKPIFNIIICCIGLFILKINLLLTRFYFRLMPTYVAIGLDYYGYHNSRARLYHVYPSRNPSTVTNQT